MRLITKCTAMYECYNINKNHINTNYYYFQLLIDAA